MKPPHRTIPLLFLAGGEGRLVEFAFDANLNVDTPTAKALRGVSAFQQFAIPQKDGKAIAAGCVPTSAASVLGFPPDPNHHEPNSEIQHPRH